MYSKRTSPRFAIHMHGSAYQLTHRRPNTQAIAEQGQYKARICSALLMKQRKHGAMTSSFRFEARRHAASIFAFDPYEVHG